MDCKSGRTSAPVRKFHFWDNHMNLCNGSGAARRAPVPTLTPFTGNECSGRTRSSPAPETCAGAPAAAAPGSQPRTGAVRLHLQHYAPASDSGLPHLAGTPGGLAGLANEVRCHQSGRLVGGIFHSLPKETRISRGRQEPRGRTLPWWMVQYWLGAFPHGTPAWPFRLEAISAETFRLAESYYPEGGRFGLKA